MQTKSDNIKFKFYNDANKVADKLFESLSSRYQVNLDASVTGNDFHSDSVQMMYYKCHEVLFRRGGSYIDSPYWIKNKKTTLKPKNEDDKCFQYAVTVALHYEQTNFINKYNWKGINYLSKIYNWKTFENNNLPIFPNILYIKEKK